MKPGETYVMGGMPIIIAWSVESDLCLVPADRDEYRTLVLLTGTQNG